MGACDFTNKAKGRTADEAFNAARQEAGYESGYGGYSGTIVEKTDYRLMTVPAGMDAQQCVDKLMRDDDFTVNGFNPFHDKWGPAGCFDLGTGEFLFFGMASS